MSICGLLFRWARTINTKQYSVSREPTFKMVHLWFEWMNTNVHPLPSVSRFASLILPFIYIFNGNFLVRLRMQYHISYIVCFCIRFNEFHVEQDKTNVGEPMLNPRRHINKTTYANKLEWRNAKSSVYFPNNVSPCWYSSKQISSLFHQIVAWYSWNSVQLALITHSFHQEHL